MSFKLSSRYLLFVSCFAFLAASVFFDIHWALALKNVWQTDALVNTGIALLYLAFIALAFSALLYSIPPFIKCVKFVVFCVWVFYIWMLMLVKGDDVVRARRHA